jgi:hypothetical protein
MSLFHPRLLRRSFPFWPKREAGYEAAGFRGLNRTDNPWNGAADAAGLQIPGTARLANGKPGLCCQVAVRPMSNRAPGHPGREACAMGQFITVEELPRYAPGELVLDSPAVGKADFRLRVFRYAPSDIWVPHPIAF